MYLVGNSACLHVHSHPVTQTGLALLLLGPCPESIVKLGYMSVPFRCLAAAIALSSLVSLSLSAHHSHLENVLLQKWSEDHQLNLSRLPQEGSIKEGVHSGSTPESIAKYGILPRAPHLEDCQQKQRRIEEAEQRSMNGDDPPWADPKNPHPPWIRGSDSDNLAGTRQAQTDLWLHQFPRDPSCSKSRLLVVKWGHRGIGIGASIHLMSRALQVAVSYNRVLVFLNSSFARAQHDGCLEFGRWGSFSCYWAPATSEGCEARAAQVTKPMPESELRQKDVFRPLMQWRLWDKSPDNIKAMMAAEKQVANQETFIYLDDTGGLTRFWSWWKGQKQTDGLPVMDGWGKPWIEQPLSVEYMEGTQLSLGPADEALREALWWSAQSARFLLRWPSLYLCHLTNRARQGAYGPLVAKGILSIMDALGSFPEETNFRGVTPWHEWEPYVPRPILSMHIRQGDKAKEMKLNGVREFFTAAYTKRLRTPDLKLIWLSTEMETAIEESKSMKGWHVLFTSGVQRQQTLGQAMWQAEAMGGLEGHVGMSFANLVISAQCDEFVGTLGSNWSRLINELRKTNGRFTAVFTSLTGYPE